MKKTIFSIVLTFLTLQSLNVSAMNVAEREALARQAAQEAAAQEQQREYNVRLAAVASLPSHDVRPRPAGHAFRQALTEKYRDLRDGTTLYWLYMPPVGEALVHFDARTNRMQFVSPDVPSQELPQGLYYWKTFGANPVVGNRSLHTQVSNTPERGKKFVYASASGQYVAADNPAVVYDASKSKIHGY